MTRLRLVVDANVVISAFLRDGTTRELLLDAPFDLYAPSWLRREVEHNFLELADRKRIPRTVAKALMDHIMAKVQEVPEPIIAQYARQALERCRKSGAKDAPYVACAMAVDAGIWTHDRSLSQEARIRIYTTQQLRARFLE